MIGFRDQLKITGDSGAQLNDFKTANNLTSLIKVLIGKQSC